MRTITQFYDEIHEDSFRKLQSDLLARGVPPDQVDATVEEARRMAREGKAQVLEDVEGWFRGLE